MTIDKIAEVASLYRLRLKSMAVVAVRYGDPLQHVLWMVEIAIPQLVQDDKRDKAMRWLCFVQGVLYCHKLYTIDELRAHNRPDQLSEAGDE